MEFLFKKSEIKTDFAKTNNLIHGFPKSGKTTLASSFFDKEGRPPLFIPTEDGHGAVEVYCTPKITHWGGFRNLIGVMVENKEKIKEQHSCFVIDLVSDLNVMCEDYTAKKNNVSYVGEIAHGKGWSQQKREFQSSMNALFSIMPVNFISHSVEKEIVWNGERIKTQAPSMSKGCTEFINGKVDTIMWITSSNTTNKEQSIVIGQNSGCISGSRFKSIVGSHRFIPDDPVASFNRLQELFEGGANG